MPRNDGEIMEKIKANCQIADSLYNLPSILPKERIQRHQNTHNKHSSNRKTIGSLKHLAIYFQAVRFNAIPIVEGAYQIHHHDADYKYKAHPI